MANFSAGLRLIDLDDFITPSQSCIKPVTVNKNTAGRAGGEPIKIQVEDDDTYKQVSSDGTTKYLEKVSVSLNDCLACSGCVTSAESVLIAAQSHKELLKVLEENSKLAEAGKLSDRQLVVVSVSPQSTASLSARYGLSFEQTARRLAGFFTGMGVDCVLDTAMSRNFSLLECQREFVQRYNQRQEKGSTAKCLPMLASACPGWVCYAEKTHGDYILPYMSTAKSPQQVMGTLVKGSLARHHGKRRDQVYHVTVMPCYDKKLEASRDDFREGMTRDVDCVVTTGEIEQMLQEKGVDLVHTEDGTLHSLMSALDGPDNGNSASAVPYSHVGGGSGGYLEHIFSYAAKVLFGVEVKEIQYTTGRNKDFRETALVVGDKTVLRFAMAYGFRNIQNLVQKIKRGKCPYDFVEVMACPSGCLNGGGQLRADPDSHSKELLQRVQALYDTVPCQPPTADPAVQWIYEHFLDGVEGSKTHTLLHTTYHGVEKIQSGLTAKW